VTTITGLATDVAAAGAVQLGFGIAPLAMQEAGTFWPPFTVEVQDASGRRIPGASGSVTLSLATGSDKLDGTLTRPVVNGTAVFSGVSYDLVELIEINADSSGLMGIAMEPIDVVTATPLRLLVHEAPRALETTGATWAPFAARIVGIDGRLARGVSDTVTLGVASGGGGGALSGTLSLSAADGIATFSDIGFDTASGVQVSFTGAGIQESPRSFVTVLEEGTTPVRMRFEDPAPPFEAVGGLWQPFSLRIEDEEGRLVTNPAMPVAVTIELTSGTGIITGTTTRTAVEGIVTFDDLRYDTAENISYDFTAAGLERLFGTARGLSRSIGIITIRTNP
ncbi:MAG: hypothetical protein KDH09_09445, partial [Chrysiogenetes bacterium]|nr:hypothetical protein [Chrysiogenetes bacterium]